MKPQFVSNRPSELDHLTDETHRLRDRVEIATATARARADMDFVLTMMDCLLTMMGFVLKMMGFVLKMWARVESVKSILVPVLRARQTTVCDPRARRHRLDFLDLDLGSPSRSVDSRPRDLRVLASHDKKQTGVPTVTVRQDAVPCRQPRRHPLE